MATPAADEERRIQEGLLELLFQRKQLIRGDISAAKETKDVTQLRLTELQQKLSQLHTSRQQHLELQQELQQALEKSRERLLKMMGQTDIFHNFLIEQNEEEEQQQQQISTTPPPVVVDHQMENSENKDNEMTNRSELLSTTARLSYFTAGETLAEFWCVPKSRLPCTSSTLIPTFNQEQLIIDMMNVTSLMALSKDAHSGMYRRESLYTTILWIPGKDHADEEQQRQNHQNLHNRREIDAHVTLCPYELAGECADMYCPFQHLSSKRENQIVSREKLRLPDLKLPAAPSSCEVHVTPERPKKRQRVMEEVARSFACSTESSNTAMEQEQTTDWKEEDFITLPKCRKEINDSEDEEDKNDEDDRQTESERRHDMSAGDNHDSDLCFWWLSDDKKIQLTKHNLSRLSLLEWMDKVCEIKVDSRTTTIIQPPPNTLIPFVGKMIDAIRLCVHAGRFDIARGIGNLVMKFLSDPSLKNCRVANHLIHPTTDVMELVTSAWRYHHQAHGPLPAFFKAIVVMAIVSEYIKICHFQNDDSGLKQTSVAMFDVIQGLFKTGSNKKKLKRDMQHLAELNRTSIPEEVNLQAILQLSIAYRQGHHRLNETLNCSKYMIERDSLATGLQAIITRGFSALDAALAFIHPLDPTKSLLLFSHIDETVRTLSSETDDPLLLTVLAPIKALQACVLVRQRKYRQAQLCIESHLHDEWGLMKFSELLWCQYVQLRASLPWSPEFQSENHILPIELFAEHEIIAIRIHQLGVNCFHLSMSGDLPLLKAASDSKKRGRSIEPWVEAVINKDSFLKSLDLSNFVFTGFLRKGEKSVTSIPLSIFVGGWAISSLNLMNCNITELPIFFGQYLPNLRHLVLQNNKLTSLSPTLGLLKKLEKLNISGNLLKRLPPSLGNCKELKYLDASYNQLTIVTEALEECQSLESLKLDHNPQLIHPSCLVTKLRNLKEFKLGGLEVIVTLPPKSKRKMPVSVKNACKDATTTSKTNAEELQRDKTLTMDLAASPDAMIVSSQVGEEIRLPTSSQFEDAME